MNLTKTAAAASILAGVFALTGCGTASLDTLTTVLDNNQTAMNGFDNAEQETVSFVQQAIRIQKLAGDDSETLTTSEKVVLITDMRDAIWQKQQSINTLKEQIRSDVTELKANVKSFKELGLTLDAEEKATVTSYVDSLRTIRVELKATYGLVYKKLAALRGHYQLANIDTILATYQTADDAMDVRVEGATEIASIVASANAFVVSKLG